MSKLWQASPKDITLATNCLWLIEDFYVVSIKSKYEVLQDVKQCANDVGTPKFIISSAAS